MARLKLLSVMNSPDPDKKLTAKFETAEGRSKTVHFGQRGADDYTKTHNAEQRARYLERHGRGREDWSDPTSPGALSRYILWGESTSLARNIAAFRSRFGL